MGAKDWGAKGKGGPMAYGEGLGFSDVEIHPKRGDTRCFNHTQCCKPIYLSVNNEIKY